MLNLRPLGYDNTYYTEVLDSIQITKREMLLNIIKVEYIYVNTIHIFCMHVKKAWIRHTSHINDTFNCIMTYFCFSSASKEFCNITVKRKKPEKGSRDWKGLTNAPETEKVWQRHQRLKKHKKGSRDWASKPWTDLSWNLELVKL